MVHSKSISQNKFSYNNIILFISIALNGYSTIRFNATACLKKSTKFSSFYEKENIYK